MTIVTKTPEQAESQPAQAEEKAPAETAPVPQAQAKETAAPEHQVTETAEVKKQNTEQEVE
jgi:hypothetical protein